MFFVVVDLLMFLFLLMFVDLADAVDIVIDDAEFVFDVDIDVVYFLLMMLELILTILII